VKVLRRTLIFLGAVALVIATFYAFEGIRGMRAWRKAKARLDALGIPTDFKSLAPPPVPDSENFAMTPLLAPLSDYTLVQKSSGSLGPVWRDPAGYRRAMEFNAFKPAQPLATWRLGMATDMAFWQAQFREWKKFPIPAQPGVPAEDVLFAFSKCDPEFTELRAAALRPRSQFKIHRDEAFNLILHHLAPVRTLSQSLELRASALLELGRVDEAFDDMLLGSRLAESVDSDAVMDSALERISMTETVVQIVWEGLRQRRWADGQLAGIGKLFSRWDIFAVYRRALEGEQACDIAVTDRFRDNTREVVAGAVWAAGQVVGAQTFFSLVPYGWFEQNKATVADFRATHSFSIIDATNRLFDTTAFRRAERELNELRAGFHVYRIGAFPTLPISQSAALKSAAIQSALDLGRIACALERYWLKHGKYPGTTSELAPAFIDKVPHDVMTGTPLKYRLTPDGRFTLYSVGFDEHDDGGMVFFTSYGGRAPPYPEIQRGDWVWSYEDKVTGGGKK
jgi:hypothetical protein